MCAKNPIDMPVPAFAKQVEVEICELWSEGVRIVGVVFSFVSIQPVNPVVLRNLRPADCGLENAGAGDAVQDGSLGTQMR